jgi:acyl-CoA thioester hydrolase
MRYHETPIKVRFHEVDSFNVVYHGNYIPYLEAGRLDLTAKFDVSIQEMNDGGVFAPVIDLKCQYKTFAKFGDELVVKTTVRPQERAMLTFVYRIERPSDGALIVEAETTHVLMTTQGKMLYAIPGDLAEKLGRMMAYLSDET